MLATLKPAFTDGGTITAGNASQMSDAAAAGLLTSREAALQVGLTPMVEIIGRAVMAGPDTTLHLKPAAAAAKLLATHGLSVDDIGVWEINEAFAGVVIASARALGLSLDRINPYGGAIALGHPLGTSGFRLIMTLANAMQRNQHTWGVGVSGPSAEKPTDMGVVRGGGTVGTHRWIPLFRWRREVLRLQRAVDGGSGDVEQFGEVGDGVVAGAVHAAQFGLLLGRQLRSAGP